MRRIALGIVLLASQLLLISCSDDEGDDPSSRIEILPASTLLMKFETFAANSNGRQESFANAMRAGGYVLSWKKIMNKELELPVKSYLKSLDKKADYIDESWVWTADVTLADGAYSSKLMATEVEDGHSWTMLTSKSGDFTDFVSMEGFSAADRKSGTWDLYKYPVDSIPMLSVFWFENEQGEIDHVKYTANKSESYIDYKTSGELPYDGSYELMNNGNSISIAWNKEKKFGWITEPSFYNDEDAHCWNASYADDQCQ